jgi:hypothetical protein
MDEQVLASIQIEEAAIMQKIQDYMDFLDMEPIERQPFEHIFLKLMGKQSQTEIIEAFSKSVANWIIYQRYYEFKEEYQICDKIQKIVIHESQDLVKALVFIGEDKAASRDLAAKLVKTIHSNI